MSRQRFYSMVLLGILCLCAAPAMAADIPDAVENTFREIVNLVGGTEATIAARVTGDVDGKTVLLAAKPINGLWLKDEAQITDGVRLQLSLDWIYDPLILVGQDVDWHGGIGLRGQAANAEKAVTFLIGVGAVSSDVDEDGFGWCFGVGYSWRN